MNRVISARTVSQTVRSYWTMNRRDSQRAFSVARRHSRLVRFLRIALPLAIVFAFVVLALMTYLNPLRNLGGLPVNIGSTVVHGSKITMEQPKLSGFTRDARAYNLTADSAAQDLTKPDVIELNNIHAQVEMKDKSTVHMSALGGTYDSKNETLKLVHNIKLDSTNGYSGLLSEATVDIKKGDVSSDHPVKLKMLQGTLNANRLRITESGDLVRFDQGVNMTMMLNTKNVAKSVTNQAAAPTSASGK
jgi:lipopolysaccharide export system protein LptC